jgi:hypothetical protein
LNSKSIIFLLALVYALTFPLTLMSAGADDREITDENFRFTFVLPGDWSKTDSKLTNDSDAISYSFERKDKKCTIMLLAFKLESVKNLEDFIYTMEKDVSLNIPKRQGDYNSFDSGTFDGKSAVYKDVQFVEHIYFYRTKLPEAPYNFVYMLRFITTSSNINTDLENQIKKISDSFLPTAK